ncbi:hypothetical protein [Effusibacillus pohliae]|uniref:hypothetical protein n=1 Tax=Effusibacillus pohliae TaxID=232270 RepID=UPI000362A44F|nr:hypothetical protein [Effusibacillus pohliae]
MDGWVMVLLVLQLLLIIGLLVYFIRSGSWDEEVKYAVLEEEETDPDVLPNPYRKAWQDYLSSR